MAYYEMMPAGLPAGLQAGMDSVLNKKFGTATSYAPGTWPDTVNLMGPLPEKTIVSWPVADFSDGADDVPTKSLIVTIPPTLTGVSSVSETRTGRNLADMTNFESGTFNENKPVGTSYENMLSSNSARSRIKTLFPISEVGLVITCASDYDVFVTYFDENQLYLGTYASWTKTRTVTRTNGYYVAIAWRKSDNTTIQESDYTDVHLMIELGSTSHSYEPYIQPKTYSANLGRTVHGAEVDIVNGTGKKTHKGYTLDNLTWSGGIVGGADWCWYVDLSADGLKLPTNSEIFSGICDNYTPIRYNGVATNQNTIALRSNGFLYVNNGSDTTEPTGKVTIELATPAAFTFTGQEIPTMLGYNAFWSDQGDTEVTYRADINLALGGN